MSVGVTPERLAVGIVADDLTGANDSAVQFAQAGWVASLSLVSQPGDVIDGGAVHALVSDSRAQHHDTAKLSTAAAVDTIRAAHGTRLFLKIDSTMRGSVLAQIEGALESWSLGHPDSYAVVCPAYPGMGRAVVAGQLLVNGARVETTSIGTDPVTPVTTSDLATLLPGSVRVEIGATDAATARSRIEAATASGARIIVIDAETGSDLARIADAVAALGPRAVPVGAAGLAVAMAAAWSSESEGHAVAQPDDTEPESAATAIAATAPTVPAIAATSTAPRRVLYVISSLHDVSRTQLRQLAAAHAPSDLLLLAPSLTEVLDPASIADWARAQIAAAIAATETTAEARQLPTVVVVSTPDARATASGTPTDTAHASSNTPTTPAARETAAITIATSLAIITDAVFDHATIDALVLVGGEGARAVLDRLGARSIRVHDAIREGIPLGAITGGKANGLAVVTKAGGFGAPEVLAELASELTTNAQGARP